MKVQRVTGERARSRPTRGRVALRYGPLVYNIEKVDQDIDKALAPAAPLTTEWKADLLGGVMVIKGTFADGTPLTAIPNYARCNREPAPPPAPAPPAAQVTPPGAPAAGAGQPRRPPPPPTSIVWIREQ